MKRTLFVAALLLAGCGGTSVPTVEEPATTPETDTTTGLSKEDGRMLLDMIWLDFTVSERDLMCDVYADYPNVVISELGDMDPLTDDDLHEFFQETC